MKAHEVLICVLMTIILVIAVGGAYLYGQGYNLYKTQDVLNYGINMQRYGYEQGDGEGFRIGFKVGKEAGFQEGHEKGLAEGKKEQPVGTEELKVADYHVRLFDGGLDFTARLDSTSTINGTAVYEYSIYIVVLEPANYKIKIETPNGQLIRETTIKDTYRGLAEVVTHTSPERIVVLTAQRDSKVEKVGLRPS